MTAKAVRIEIPEALRALCLWSAAIVLCSTGAAAWFYQPSHPDFSPATTYLSEIGGAGGWPAAFFNTGLLIVAPLRLLVAVLLALRLREFGLSARTAHLIVAMTASPYNFGPAEHKLGILLYFCGTVFVLSLIGTVEYRLAGVPRLLAAMSGLTVIVYAAFAAMLGAWGAGLVPKTTPAPLEWICFAASILWVVSHGLVLGRANLRAS